MRFYILVLLTCLFCFSGMCASADPLPEDRSAAVILAYHRIGEDTSPQTNLTTEQFHTHLQEILSGGYTVISLSQAVDAFKNNTALPDRALVISFDGGYKSAYENGMQLLLEHEIPFSVFVSPENIQNGNPEYIGWRTLKNLRKHKNIEIGLIGSSLTRLSLNDENDILAELNSGKSLFRDHLRAHAQYISYPFGEYSRLYRDTVEKNGFEAALSLGSGVAHSNVDLFALPRFSMTENYGSPERFKLVANARAMPVYDIEPADPFINTENPRIGFTLPNALLSEKNKLSCFISGQGTANIEILGQNRVEIRPASPLYSDRTRVNCTMPDTALSKHDERPVWRWFGMLLTKSDS